MANEKLNALTTEKKLKIFGIISAIMFAFSIFNYGLLNKLPGIAIAAMLGMMIFWKDAPKWIAYLSTAPIVIRLINFIIELFPKKSIYDEYAVEAYYSYRPGAFVSFFNELLTVLAMLAFAAVIIAVYANPLPKYKEYAVKYWYAAPAIFILNGIISFIFCFIHYITRFTGDLDIIIYILRDGLIPLIAAVIGTIITYGLALIYVVKPKQVITVLENKNTEAVTGDNRDYSLPAGEGYISLTTHAILSVVTFGIWNLYWVYKTTAFLNSDRSEKQRNPVTKLLLYMFIPMYAIYWSYQSSKRLNNLTKDKGISTPYSAVVTIMSIINPIISSIILQDGINACCTAGIEMPISEGTKPEKYDIIAHALLLVVTFGIWNLIWVYKTTTYLNSANSSKNTDPAIAVILNLFIPLYQIFWYYKASYQINKIEASRNKLPIDPIILVVLATMSPLVASIIVQEKLNTIG